MNDKAFVARCGFALCSRQCVFVFVLGVQKHRKVFAHRNKTLGEHVFGGAAHHHPVAVAAMYAQQGVSHRATHKIGLHGFQGKVNTLGKLAGVGTPKSLKPNAEPLATLSTFIEATLSRLIKVGPGRCSITQACT